MTMGFYMLCHRPISSVDEWQTAIDELGFDLQLPTTLNVATSLGALTAIWRGNPVVFEFTEFPYEEIEEYHCALDLGQEWPNAYAMYTGSSFSGCAGAIMAGVALVHRTGGRFFDPQDSLILKPDEAVQYAHRTVGELLTMMRALHH